MPEETTKQFTDVPDEVYDFIDDPKQLSLVDEIISKHGLGGMAKAQGIIDTIPNLVVSGKLHPAEIADKLAVELNLTQEKAHEVALDVVRLLLLPVRKHLPEVDRFASKWEIGDAAQPAKETNKVSANAFVRDEVEKYKLEMPTPVLQSRFEKTLSQYLAKAKTKDETVDILTRDKQIGGLELNPSATEKLLAGLTEDAKHIAPQSKPIPLPARTKVHPVEEVKPKKVFDAVTVSQSDEKEIKEHESKIPSVEPALDVVTATSQALKNIKIAVTMSAEDKKKLEAIVGSRMRGVRDSYALRNAFEANVSLGGLGLKGADLAQATEAVEEVFDKLDKKIAHAASESKKEFVAKRVERFKEKSVNEEKLTSRDNEPKLIKKNPKVQDVVAPRKLVGPVEELAGMTVESFRRLGNSAEESANEILERVKLLEEESYGRRLNGISAWRRSALYATYVALVSESMRDGKAIELILADHKSSGENTLTLEEVRAILKLNRTLRV